MKQIAVYFNATKRDIYKGDDRNDVDLFRDLLAPFLKNVEFVMVDSAHDEFPDDPTQFDGVILGGSAAFVTQKEPWMDTLFEHIHILDEAKIPTWGICFGHQAIATVFGGKIEARTVTLGAPHLEILTPEPWMHPYSPTLNLYAGNFQQVTEAPKSMRRIGLGRGNPNAMLAKDDHLVSLQFHPEFTQWIIESYADSCLSDRKIDFATYQKAKSEIHERNDAIVMAKWMAKFFLQNWEKSPAISADLKLVSSG